MCKAKKSRQCANVLAEPLEDRRLLSTVVVNTAIDSVFPPYTGIVSLRNAIAIANSSTSSTIITFDPSVFATPQTIKLVQGTLTLNTPASETTTIVGPTAGVTIDGNAQGDVFDLDRGATSISELTITNAKGSGIIVYSAASLTLSNATLSSNNSSGTNDDAGGIGCYSSTVALINDIVSGNFGSDGGGVENNGGTVTLTNCTVSNNASYAGGGVYASGATTITNCTISGNSVTPFPGGGAGVGGGVWAGGGNLTVTNCTIAANVASNGAGGLETSGQFTTTIDNTIIAENTLSGVGASSPDVNGSFNSLGYNLIGTIDGSTGWNASDLTGTAARPLNPELSPPGSYGGPTQTMALLVGSPALNAGFNTFAVDSSDKSLTTDQRGLPRIYGPSVDIGAYESQPAELAGDVNHDGTVNATDFLLLARDFGQTTPMYEGGDLDGNGTVNLSDLLLLVRNFGKTSSAVSSATSGGVIQSPSVGIRRPALRRIAP